MDTVQLRESSLIRPLVAAMAEARRLHPASALARIEEMLDTFLGRRPFQFPDPQQRPELGYFPGLTTKPFYEGLPWMAALERHAPTIREELLHELSSNEAFQPYFAEGETEFRQSRFGAGLKSAKDWTVAMISFGGVPQPAAAKFPKTVAALAEVFPRHSATTSEISYTTFSAITPGSHVPPHCGLCNFKLTGHLGLIVPKGRVELRVGSERRSWQEGRCLAFDDTYEHEVWQEGEGIRVVLMFWVWHPELTEIEVDVLKKLVLATRRVLGTTGTALSYFVGTPL